MLKLAVTGFVSEQAGSVASANALLVRELLLRGHEIHFFSKASFVDPRPAVGNLPGFRFFNVTNAASDQLRRRVKNIPIAALLAETLDTFTYNKLLSSELTRVNAIEKYDLCCWMGDYARGRTPGLPAVSFVQGLPGTDARSLFRQSSEVKRLAGLATALKWQALARIRLSRVGLPPFEDTDYFIVGSSQSKRTLHSLYRIPEQRISSLPYPIDLKLFDLMSPESSADTVDARSGGSHGDPARPILRICWLGRIVPRKRLDLFLEGSELAIREGIDLRLTVVGGVGFIPGYDKMIEAFPFRDRLTWKKAISRQEVPSLLRAHDVLVQPSDEENFGSSVAEAQACGLPVIVGVTNGNADYLCSRDIHLSDDRPETLATALREMAQRKVECRWGDPGISRHCAEQYFSLDKVTTCLLEVLEGLEPARR